MKDSAGRDVSDARPGSWFSGWGDIDNDGDPDLVFVRLNDKPVLLRNNVGQEQPWIGLRLVGKSSNRDAIGAKIVVHAGKRMLTRWITGGGSFLSSHDKRVLVGLGGLGDVKAADGEIRWPHGATQAISSLPLNRYHEIVEQVGRRELLKMGASDWCPPCNEPLEAALQVLTLRI